MNSEPKPWGGDARTDYGLWQVMRSPEVFPATVDGLEGVFTATATRPVADVRLIGDNLFGSVDEQQGPTALDGDPGVAEVGVLGQWVVVSAEMFADTAGMAGLVQAMAEGRPIPMPRSSIERRKDLAARARIRFGALMLAAWRRPDPAIERMVRDHPPVTHSPFGKHQVEMRPWCLSCGPEAGYPCDVMHMVAEAIGHDID